MRQADGNPGDSHDGTGKQQDRPYVHPGRSTHWGQRSECAFVLEAADGYYFQNGWEEYRRKAGASDHHTDFHIQAATHGYLPDRDGYRTFFMAKRSSFLKGARVEKCHWSMKGRRWPEFWAWIWAGGWTDGERTDSLTVR